MGLFDPSVPSGTTTSTSNTSSTQTMPPWLEEHYRTLFGLAGATTAQPYQSYTGPRVAEPSGALTQAWDLAKGSVGAWQPTFAGALQAGARGAAPFDPSQLNQYMNPYVSNVVDEVGRLGIRNLNEALIPQVNDAFTMAGQPMSQRNYDFLGKTIRDTTADIAGKQGALLSEGFKGAMGDYGAWTDRARTGSGALANLATGQTNLNLADISTLQTAGAQEMEQWQKNLDVAYKDFQAQRDYPKTQLDWLANLGKGAPNATTTNSATTSTQPYTGPTGPSQFNQILGVLSGVKGLFGKSGGAVRMARGGALRAAPRRPMGMVDLRAMMMPDVGALTRGGY